MEKNKSEVNRAQEGDQQKKKNKKRKEIFPYGNYRNYYGYRIGREMEEDPRLKVFNREWFEGKECLDIGCNNGNITIQIAKKFNCKSILGVDIDSNRVEDANWQLRKFVKMESDEKHRKTSRSKISKNESGSSSDNEIKQRDTDLSDVVSFRQENYVHGRDSRENAYDTILCLSVSKWIHLNWGDDGLISLFSKIWKQLSPGGIFILEPQPWKSYEKNRRTSETTAAIYKEITLRPDCFQEILLDKIGFKTVEDVTSSLSGCTTGFNRPILVFCK